MSGARPAPAVWFPAIKAGTGADVFTERLCEGLRSRGLRAEIAWIPHRAEYLPWTVGVPNPPSWANIAHVNTWLHARFIPKKIPLLATMHLCVHDAALEQYKTLPQSLYHRLWVRPIEERLLRSADGIVAVSHYTAAAMRREFRVGEVDVIHNGVPLPPSSCRPIPVRRHDRFRLLYVGNWSKRKGVDLLRPIMESLGEGFELWYTADAHGRHLGAELPDNAKCLGRLDEVGLHDALHHSDALILPTRLEGFGFVAAEAMMCALPVIASRCSSIPEIVDTRVGILCEPDDVDAFVSAARELAGNETLRRRMAAQARALAEERFSVCEMVDAYVEKYEELLKLNPS